MYHDKCTTGFIACGVSVYSTRRSLSRELNSHPKCHNTWDLQYINWFIETYMENVSGARDFLLEKCDKLAVVHYWNQNTLWHFRFHVYNDSILVVHPPGLILAACSSEDWGLAVFSRNSDDGAWGEPGGMATEQPLMDGWWGWSGQRHRLQAQWICHCGLCHVRVDELHICTKSFP